VLPTLPPTAATRNAPITAPPLQPIVHTPRSHTACLQTPSAAAKPATGDWGHVKG